MIISICLVFPLVFLLPIASCTDIDQCPARSTSSSQHGKWLGSKTPFSESVPQTPSQNATCFSDTTWLRCLHCEHHCVLDEGHRGICGVVHSFDGELYNMVHSYPSSINVDPVEKKPLYHFLPGSWLYSVGTVGCNMRCSFCQNWQISDASKGVKSDSLDDLRRHLMARKGKMTPRKIVSEAVSTGCAGIAYTYNEPTIWLDYVRDIAVLARERGLVNVLVSNGYQSIEGMQSLIGLIDGINIDLKSFSNRFYSKLTGSRLKVVLRNIRLWVELGVHVEVTTLVIPGENDSEKELRQIAEFVHSVDPNIVWHLSAYYDAGFRMDGKGRTPFRSLLRGYHVGRKAGLRYVYLGNVQSEKHSATYCPVCGHTLVTRGRWGREGRQVGIDSLGRCASCGEPIYGTWYGNSEKSGNAILVKNPARGFLENETVAAIAERVVPVTLITGESDGVVTILFASQTGVSEVFAERISDVGADILGRLGIPMLLRVVDLAEYDESTFDQERFVILVTSTMFYGRIPHNGERFYDYVVDSPQPLSEDWLESLRFLIVGIGSTGRGTEEHLTNYQTIPHLLHHRFEELGGEGCGVLEANKKDRFEERLEEILERIWKEDGCFVSNLPKENGTEEG